MGCDGLGRVADEVEEEGGAARAADSVGMGWDWCGGARGGWTNTRVCLAACAGPLILPG